MVNIRNIQRKDALLHINARKPHGYFVSLMLFHNHDYISPLKLFLSDWIGVIKSCRFGLKSVFKDFFSSLAAVFILIADKQYVHTNQYVFV